MKYLRIEQNLTLKAINYLEEITKEPICDTHPELEKELLQTHWENEKLLRSSRFNLDQIIDNLNFKKYDLKEFYKEADEKINFLEQDEAEIYKASQALTLKDEISFLVKSLNKKYTDFNWSLGYGNQTYIVLASKKVSLK